MRPVLLSILCLLCLSASAQADGADYHLAMGGSTAAGTQSSPMAANGSYAQLVTSVLQGADPSLQLADIACSGATSGSLLNAQTCQPGFTGSQLQQAEAFLAAHPGHVPLVTIEIGGNDVDSCAKGGVVDQNCIVNGFAQIDQNVPQIAARLRAAAGPETRLVMLTSIDPFLEYWVKGRHDLAAQSVPLADALNAKLIHDFGAPFLVGDSGSAFSTDDMTTQVATAQFGTVPKDVAVICNLTGGCSGAALAIHPNGAGHRVIAYAVLASLAAASATQPSAPVLTAPQPTPSPPPPVGLVPAARVRASGLSLRHVNRSRRLQVRFSLSAPATVLLTLTRKCRSPHRCTRRNLTLRAQAGRNLAEVPVRSGVYKLALRLSGQAVLVRGVRVR